MSCAPKRPGALRSASIPIIALTEWPTKRAGPCPNSSTISSTSSA